MKSFEIKIKSEWLQSAYYVYAISIKYKKKQYYYIGQTGDNHYHSARAPLYRIGGHFAKGVSTENQIVKYFKETILKKDVSKTELEQALLESEITYQFWEIEKLDEHDNNEQHKAKRMKAQAVEHYLIYKLQGKKGVFVLNKTVKDAFSVTKKDFFSSSLAEMTKQGNLILKKLGYEE